MKRLVQLLVFPILAMGLALPSLAADIPPVIVGRVTDVESDLLRYVPEESDWVAAVRDVPFAEGDTFYSGTEGRAEMMVPNGSRIRIGGATQIQFLALDTDFSEADVVAGLVRFYNNGRDTVVKTTSPFGYVLSYPGSAFDFYVGENSAEVVAVKGTVTFVHTGTNARYDVSVGSPSVLADRNQVASGDGTVDPDWDAWNIARDHFWAAKAQSRGPSARYLPPVLWNDAYALEENGRWVQVVYEGRQCWFWRPINVDAGWAPFTVGRWTEWYGDQTWIPAEPFGYVTHHYGNWVLVDNQWFWAPPVARPGLPLLQVDFAWYPGRVSWIHNDGFVGWIPLAPRETYYCHHGWGGPRAVVVADANIGGINVNVRGFAYAGRAVIVPQNNFYGVTNYRAVQVTNISTTTIINNYHAAPVVNNTVVANYSNTRQRYNYASVAVTQKPHASVMTRIRQNERIVQEGRRENPVAIDRQVRELRQGNVNREARVQAPRMTSYIVPANDVNRPKSEVTFHQQEVKTAGAQGGVRPGSQGHAGPGEPGRPGSASIPAGPRPVDQTQRPQSPRPMDQVQRPESPRLTDQAQRPQSPRPSDQIQQRPQGPPTRQPEPGVQAQKEGMPSPRAQGITPARPGQGAPPAQAQKPAPPGQPPQAKQGNKEKKDQKGKEKEKGKEEKEGQR